MPCASASYEARFHLVLQRRLRIGYGRAAPVLDQMEREA